MPPTPNKPRRVAFLLDLRLGYKHHAALFTGTQRYARTQGWESVIDENVADKLPARRTRSMPYDGILCRANRKLVQRADQLSLPLVNVWLASPAWREAPGVFPDCAAAGRLRAEHLLARGLRRFAVLARNTRGSRIESAAFAAAVREAGFPCPAIKLPVRSTKTYSWWEEQERRIGRFMREWQPPIGVFAATTADEVSACALPNHRAGDHPNSAGTCVADAPRDDRDDRLNRPSMRTDQRQVPERSDETPYRHHPP